MYSDTIINQLKVKIYSYKIVQALRKQLSIN